MDILSAGKEKRKRERERERGGEGTQSRGRRKSLAINLRYIFHSGTISCFHVLITGTNCAKILPRINCGEIGARADKSRTLPDLI